MVATNVFFDAANADVTLTATRAAAASSVANRTTRRRDMRLPPFWLDTYPVGRRGLGDPSRRLRAGVGFCLGARRQPALRPVSRDARRRGRHRPARGLDERGALGQGLREGPAEGVACAGGVDDVDLRRGD